MNQAAQLLGADAPLIIQAEVVEGQTWPIRARVTNRAGVALVQANVTAVAVSVYHESAPAAPLAVAAPPVASVVFNALQLDGSWQQDDDGYNVAFDVDPALWGGALGANAYVVKIVLATSVAGLGPKTVLARVSVVGVPE